MRGVPISGRGVGVLGRGASPGAALPDSVVSRTADNNTSPTSKQFGLRIESANEWPDIDGRISSQTSSVTKAYVYRVSDGALMGSTDISSLSAGDAFRISEVNLQPSDGTDATRYNFVIDAEGSSYTTGYYDTDKSPITSGDGDLTITSPAQGVSGTHTTANNIVEIGNLV